MWNIRRGSLPSERAGQPVWFLVMKSYCKEEALNPFTVFLAPCVRLPPAWDHQIRAFNCQAGHQACDVIRRLHLLICPASPSQFISYRYSRVGPIPALRGGSRVIALSFLLTDPPPPPLLPGHVSVQLSFLTVVLPQSFSYVVHNLSSYRPEDWMKEEACRTAYTVITLNFFIGHFVFFLFVSGLLWP